jgi:hypothetical protein
MVGRMPRWWAIALVAGLLASGCEESDGGGEAERPPEPGRVRLELDLPRPRRVRPMPAPKPATGATATSSGPAAPTRSSVAGWCRPPP